MHEDSHDLVDDLVQVDGRELVLPLACKGQKLLRQPRRALRACDDAVAVAAQGVILRQALPQQLGVAQDAGQLVVEVVGDSACELSKRCELLRLLQLFLHLQALCDVPHDGEDQSFLGDGHAVPGEASVAAVLAAVAVDEERHGLATQQALAGCQRGMAVFLVHELDPGPRLELLEPPAQSRAPSGIQLLEEAIEARYAEHVLREVEEPIALTLGSLAVGDVAKHELNRAPSPMPNRQCDRLDDDHAAVHAQETLGRQRRPLLLLDHTPRTVDGGSPVVRMKNLGRRRSDQLLRPVHSQERLSRRVRKHDLALAGNDHAVGQTL